MLHGRHFIFSVLGFLLLPTCDCALFSGPVFWKPCGMDGVSVVSVFEASSLNPLFDNLGGLRVDLRPFDAHEEFVGRLVKDFPERVALGIRDLALLVIKVDLE